MQLSSGKIAIAVSRHLAGTCGYKLFAGDHKNVAKIMMHMRSLSFSSRIQITGQARKHVRLMAEHYLLLVIPAFDRFFNKGFGFFYVAPTLHNGSARFFEVFIVSKVEFNLLLPALTKVIE